MTDTIEKMRGSTTQILCAMATAGTVNPSNVAETIKTVFDALNSTSIVGSVVGGNVSTASREPAVTVRKSLASPDHIISLIDGKPYKTLRRHLTRHGMTPESYRAEFDLKPDYPMVAPAYSAKRSVLAKENGLGQKPA